MIGGISMTYDKVKRPINKTPILPHEMFMKILNAPKKKYDVKAAKKEAAKELRKQGFFVF